MSKSNPMHSDAWDRSAIKMYFVKRRNSEYFSCWRCEYRETERRPLYDSTSQDEDDVRGWYPEVVCRLLEKEGSITKSMCPGLEDEAYLEGDDE